MYTVYQQFESLGDPCLRKFSNRNDAESYADGLKLDIVNLISNTEVCLPVGTRKEMTEWGKALGMTYKASAGTSTGEELRFTTDAARHIADEAVVIEGRNKV